MRLSFIINAVNESSYSLVIESGEFRNVYICLCNFHTLVVNNFFSGVGIG